MLDTVYRQEYSDTTSQGDVHRIVSALTDHTGHIGTVCSRLSVTKTQFDTWKLGIVGWAKAGVDFVLVLAIDPMFGLLRADDL